MKRGANPPPVVGHGPNRRTAISYRRRATRSLSRFSSAAFVILVLAFLFLPMVLIVLFAFSASPTLNFPITGLTFGWFRQAFADPLAMQALKNSLYLAGVTMIMSGTIGTIAAFGARRFSIATRERVTYAALVPAIIPV